MKSDALRDAIAQAILASLALGYAMGRGWPYHRRREQDEDWIYATFEDAATRQAEKIMARAQTEVQS